MKLDDTIAGLLTGGYDAEEITRAIARTQRKLEEEAAKKAKEKVEQEKYQRELTEAEKAVKAAVATYFAKVRKKALTKEEISEIEKETHRWLEDIDNYFKINKFVNDNFSKIWTF